MRDLLVVYYSQSGTAESLVKSAVSALNGQIDVTVRLLRAVDCCAQNVISADLLLLVASENCGLMSGGIKEFLDRTYYPMMNNVEAKGYGLVVSAGNDGTGAVREICKYLDSLGMRKVAPPLIVKGSYSPENAARVNELALTLAAGLSVGMF